MDQNVKALESLQEAFQGSLDPEVVDLIFTQSNYVVEDALEKLLSISVSSDNCNPDSEHKPTKQNDTASIEDNTWRPCDRNTSRRNKKEHESSSFKDDESNSLALLPNGRGHSDVDTGSSIATTKREIPLDSSKQLNSTKEAEKPKGPSSSTHNHHGSNLTLASHSAQSGIEVTDQPLSSNELPPWPDQNQGYRMPHIQSLPGQPYNPYQGFPIPHNFQGLRFTGDAGYHHYNPQYQTQQNMGTYHPSALQVPGNRYPVQGAPQNRAHIKRKEVQPYNGMRKPREFYEREEKDAFSQNQTRSEETFLPRGKVLVILRGLPGSGKTTLAQKLRRDGLILSTDEFFMINGDYQFEPNDVPEAHEWNQKRAKVAMQRGVSPIIIDNTNMQAWEMRPYVSMGQRFGYKVMIKEPDTPWKWNTKELFKRNQHNVTMFSIQNMKEKYEKDLTVESILAPWKNHENVNPKVEMCCSNKDEIHEHNSECFKPMSIAPKETSRNKQTLQDEFTQVSQLSNQSSKQSKKKFEDVRQEMETLRSHGSRSPIQDMDFSLSELSQDDQSLEINKSFIKSSSFTTKTILPKPQRTPKRRERTSKSLGKMQDSEEVKENPNKVLDSKELKINSCENKRSHAISESERSVEEEEYGDDYEQKFITGLANGENTSCKTVSGKFASPGEMDKEKTRHYDNDIHSKDGQTEQDIISLGKQVVAGENTSGISHKKEIESTGFSLPRNAITTVETNRKDFGFESFLSKDIKSKIENEEETSAKPEDYLLAKTNDCDKPFKSTKIAPGFLNSAEKTETAKESSLESFKNDLSESDLSGFQFLNTCFPDIDIQILVDVLAKNQGDVTKAIESILCHEDKSSEVKSPKQNTSDIDSSGNISAQTSSFERKDAYTAPDQNLKPLQCDELQESQAAKSLPLLPSTVNYDDHVRPEHGRFQMSLEPAVAIQLLELFGRIDGVSLEGDFSPKDLIVEVDSDFAKLLYKQWRTTIRTTILGQNNTKEKFSHTEKQPKVSRTENKEDSSKRLKEKQSRAIIEQRKATDLRRIMDEQRAVEQIRREQVQSDESMAVVLKRKKLYAMFPGVDPLALDELFEVNRYELEPTVSMVQTSCNLQAKQSEFQEKQEKQEKQANSACRSYDDSPRDPVETEFQALQDPDYKDFRAEANTHYKLRDECFRKAAFAFSKKQGQLAQFYASQGHRHTEQIREANRRAAAKILENKNSNWDENSLDLHGLHVDEALSALEERLQFADSTKNYGPRYLSVITGRGNHSKQGKAKIKPAVLEYLKRNNYRIEELQPGLVRVAIDR